MIHSLSFDVMNIWFNRQRRIQSSNGQQCIIEIIGADLNSTSNERFDLWSKPDVCVICRHHRSERKTPVEGNTYNPRFFYCTKIPFCASEGFDFTVYDVNVLKGDNVIGRAFLGAERVKEIVKTGQKRVWGSGGGGTAILGLGDGVGVLKVRVEMIPKSFERRMLDDSGDDDGEVGAETSDVRP